MNITTYTVVNSNDECVSEEFDTLDEARNDAEQRIDSTNELHAVVELTYVFDDSGLVWTPNGEQTWPPSSNQVQSEIDAKQRLEELRDALRTQDISYGELAELQDLTQYIEPGDTELLEAAGVPEDTRR